MPRLRPLFSRSLVLPIALMVLTACSTSGSISLGRSTTSTPAAGDGVCPARTHRAHLQGPGLTPQQLRAAYGVDSLIAQGITGKGQTIVDVVSYGSPTLQSDMDAFDTKFGLPAIKLQIMAPLGTVPFNPADSEMDGWAGETTLDVQIIHAIAPDANIVVLTSPVDETEGTIGLPQFLKLEQYAVDHKLGYIFSQSWSASEPTLKGTAGRAEVKAFADFYQTITGQGYTILSASGDNGATDVISCQPGSSGVSSTRAVGFPANVPWVTAVGGTTLDINGGSIAESAWNGSGGGASTFFAAPPAQQALPSAVQSLLGGKRGIPDVAADADPATGMQFIINGGTDAAGGTSASTPLWAGIIALADQKAGHPLGDVNPALYKLGLSSAAASDFRDITAGNNDANAQGTPVQGFPAVPGWDPVTGLGAPLANHLVPDLAAATK
ncbi:MAG TPA: S53 family peptidase [Ktedonobacterales bacterium]|nr:S53 family peptidase [Ktedonobacterales bacterium]